MNIFVLHDNPTIAARMQADKHVPKMIVESIQMLVQGLLTNGAPADKMPLTKSKQEPHRGGYRMHPCTLWAGDTIGNWIWLYAHAEELCKEYEKRFGKKHFGAGQLDELSYALVWGEYLPDGKRTDFVRAVNQSRGHNHDLLSEDITAVQAYRSFYYRAKKSFAKWEKGTPAPPWWPTEECK